MNNTVTLLISCPDQIGINAAVTQFISENNGNILDYDQHTDLDSNMFFMRVKWSLDEFKLSQDKSREQFIFIAEKYAMQWQLYYDDVVLNVALFVSKRLHCYYDILYKYRSGQLNCKIPLIVSNHPEAKELAEEMKIPFYLIEINKENKCKQEQLELELLNDYKIDLVVLARYHQILSENFVSQYPQKIINIHHSFLPAFPGQKPYHRAFNKGVKLIGATAHYVIPELDEGPIISQDTVRISHKDTVLDLIEKGEDLEKRVFTQAIRWHIDHKILTSQNKTIVFD